MSTKYKKSSDVPMEVICDRLKELSDAVTKGPDSIRREFVMRVPAELDFDADLVLAEACRRLRKFSGIEKKPKLKEKILNASNVEKIKWDENNLIIHFTNGNVYQYFDIPEEISVGLSEADSPGSYLHREIKGNYRYSRIE